MPDKTTKKEGSEKHAERENGDSYAENCKTNEQGNWSKDQQNKGYYYDDNYGYEVYNPEADEEKEDE